MFGKIAGFELRYQLRQPLFWIVVGVFFLLTFGYMASDTVHIGDTDNVHKNGPFAIAQVQMIWTLFFMFVTTAFVANVIVRDDETGFGPIIRTTRVRKFDYLFGRFIGAFAAIALAFLAVPAAQLLGSVMPWMDAETLGPNKPVFYLYSYFVLVLPNLLLTSAIFFALATLTRSMMATYLGVIGLFVAWFVATLLGDKPELDKLMAYAEPFGLGAYGLVTKYWTATERNTLVPPLEGYLLWNRAIWLAAGAGFLALAYGLFRFADKGVNAKARREPKEAAVQTASGPLPKPTFGARTARAQMWARTKLEMSLVFKSPAFAVLMVLGVANSVGGLWLLGELFGVEIYPVTRMMISVLNGSFGLIPILIAIYYAGELVWRERDRRTAEIIDATPLPDWGFVVPKVLAISLVLLSTFLAAVATAVVIQALKGFDHFELGKYAWWYVFPEAVQAILIAALAVFFQAVSPHKFVGWGLMVLYIVSLSVLPAMGWEHHLYRYASTGQIPLSDMNGQGRFWIGAAWLRLYWSAFALILLTLAYGLWRRGTEMRLTPRLKRLPHRLAGPAGVVMAIAVATFVGCGVFIYVNTNVWNEYRTKKGDERWTADYEKTLLKYENTPQPKIDQVKLAVQVYPHQPRIVTEGTYVIENRTAEPLREVHVRFDRDTEVNCLVIAGARPKTTYDRFNYRIFAFDTPMLPGEKRIMTFTTTRAQHGFRNDGDMTSVVDNGTFVHEYEIAPFLGMDRGQLLQDRSKRKKHHLPPELRMPKLGDVKARQVNYLRHDSDWTVGDEVTITTDADQTPIAPGYRASESVKNGRRTVRFVADAPILHYFSVQSARYAVSTERYKGVEMSVYYDPQHAWNVERMHKSLRASLDYFQANFSPYQFRQARILEFPAYARFAESFANTIPWSEGLGFIADFHDPEKIDYVTYVGAHELGHQWWAHQVIGADEQGSTVLSETLAQYSALMVMKHMYGPDMIRKFLKFELDSYLKSRGGEVVEELPLGRVENQPYIHYRKGSLVMYRLQDEIGEDAVNRALRKLLHDYAFKGPPYPTSADLVADLRAEAPGDKQALITDLFEKITLYDVKTTKAVARKRADGRWDLTLTVDAKKLYADGHGKETASPMLETLDVGAFEAEPGKKDFNAKKVIAFDRRSIRSGVQTLALVVDRKPKFAGADPYNKLIDRNAEDNVVKVD